MNKIFLVEGQIGAYDEFTTYPVAAFKEQSKAEEYAKRANDYSTKLTSENIENLHKEDYDPLAHVFNPYDENWRFDRDYPTEYLVLEVPLKWNIPSEESEVAA